MKTKKKLFYPCSFCNVKGRYFPSYSITAHTKTFPIELLIRLDFPCNHYLQSLLYYCVYCSRTRFTCECAQYSITTTLALHCAVSGQVKSDRIMDNYGLQPAFPSKRHELLSLTEGRFSHLA